MMTRSFWRKAILTAVAAGGFVWLYETPIFDAKRGLDDAVPGDAGPLPAPGDRLVFAATAYCKGITTTSGVPVQSGVAAADPALLPAGSVVDVDLRNPRYDGIYTVLDTGPNVRGRQIDVYLWSCNEALQFGRKAVRLTVLRLGWNPRGTAPSFVQRFLRRAEASALPARPLPQVPSIEK